MRRNASLLFILLFSVAICGCVVPSALGGIKGSGQITTVEREFSGFTELDVHHGCKLNVTQGDTYSVVVRIDDNLVEYLRLEQDGSELTIGLQPRRSYSRVHLEADIVMPDIERLSLSGGSDGRIEGFGFEHAMKADLSGGSELVGLLDTGDLSVSLSGGSEIELEGSSDDLHLKGSGGSEIRMGGFRAIDVNARLSGGSEAAVHAEGSISGKISGGSTIRYSGSASVGNLSKSGGSSIIRK